MRHIIIPVILLLLILNLSLFCITNYIYNIGNYNNTPIRIRNKTFLNRTTDFWNWEFTHFDSNTSFIHGCPDFNTKIIVMKENNKIYSLKNNIFNNNYTMIYERKSLKCISFYDTRGALINYIGCLYKYDKRYSFFNPDGELLIFAEKIDQDWVIQPYQEVDLRFYGTFLVYVSFFRGYNTLNSDGCNTTFTIGLFIDILIVFVIGIFGILYMRYKCRRRRETSIQQIYRII